MKNVIELVNYYYRWALERGCPVCGLQYRRYHEALNGVTLADVHFERAHDVQTRREAIKQRTLQMRCQERRQGLLVAGA